MSHAVFNVAGMRCANCAAAVERAVRAVDGVTAVTINAASSRACVDWEAGRAGLRKIFDAVRKSGFEPLPLAGAAAVDARCMEKRAALKRIGVAGLGMMQTMMFVYALYATGTHGIDTAIAQYLKLAGLLLTTPVMIYSGAPFFAAAFRDVRRKSIGMDVPVAAALTLAYVASVVNTLRGSGDVYFDSVTMFIFLLSLGRFAELSVRQGSMSATEALARTLPPTALRMDSRGRTERVRVESLEIDDRVMVPNGGVIPVDGVLESPQSSADESLLTGESRPVTKGEGDRLIGGSINTGPAVRYRVTSRLGDSTLAGIMALLARGEAERPAMASAANRAASVFSVVTLATACGVALAWACIDPSRMISATLAVLVVTCPCALSLATPAVFAAATTGLARLGLLVARPDSLERLARVDTIVLDKTGTVTSGCATLRVNGLGHGWQADTALRIAAALDRHSAHPVAKALAAYDDPSLHVDEGREIPGHGVEGTVAGQWWRLGKPDFVRSKGSSAGEVPTCRGEDSVALGNAQGIVATFDMRDEARPDAAAAVEAFERLGLRVILASGDSQEAVRRVASSLGIATWLARMNPEEKLGFVREQQSHGRRVAMIGDGINDGPVLAAADASCAIAQGAAIAQASAGLLLMNESLAAVARGLATARRALRVAKQNLAWALVYNVIMVPLAALGVLPPWVAAAGMSTSSLAVMLNAARVARPAQA